MKFKKEISFAPAYDKRHPDPSKNYGIHSVEMRWALIGNIGVVQFVVYTGWDLLHVKKELESKGHFSAPMGADIGYHSLKPMYEDQTVMSETCEYLNGQPCYYDGSSLAAGEVLNLLIEKGSDAVWKHLEDYYRNVFKPDTD